MVASPTRPQRLLALPFFLALISPLSMAFSGIPLVGFLTRLQAAALRSFGPDGFDPKVFVDMPLRSELAVVEAAFDGLPRRKDGVVPARELRVFMKRYLGEAGSDLVAASPGDFVEVVSGFLLNVKSGRVREWAVEVHGLWKNLSRKISEDVRIESDLHTLLPLPGDVVVPGSRFREVYYWDSYWIIRWFPVFLLFSFLL